MHMSAHDLESVFPIFLWPCPYYGWSVEISSNFLANSMSPQIVGSGWNGQWSFMRNPVGPNDRHFLRHPLNRWSVV